MLVTDNSNLLLNGSDCLGISCIVEIISFRDNIFTFPSVIYFSYLKVFKIISFFVKTKQN